MTLHLALDNINAALSSLPDAPFRTQAEMDVFDALNDARITCVSSIKQTPHSTAFMPNLRVVGGRQA